MPDLTWYFATLLIASGLLHSVWAAAGIDLWVRRRWPLGGAPTPLILATALAVLSLLVPVIVVALAAPRMYDAPLVPGIGHPSSLPESSIKPLAWVIVSLVTAWLLGVAVQLTRLLQAMARARRLVDEAMQARTSGPPCRFLSLPVLEHEQSNGPCVIGVRQPVVLMPRAAKAVLTPHQLEIVLRHEAAHVQHRDHIAELLLCTLEAVLWFNPWTQRCAHRVRLEAELQCDQSAATTEIERRSLAEGLVRLGATRLYARTLAAVTSHGDLSIRVHRLLCPVRPSETVPSSQRVAILWLVAALFCFTPIAAATSAEAIRFVVGTRQIHAVDPAGAFLATVTGGWLHNVTIGGREFRVVQRGRVANVLDGTGTVVLTLDMRIQGFQWTARPSIPTSNQH